MGGNGGTHRRVRRSVGCPQNDTAEDRPLYIRMQGARRWETKAGQQAGQEQAAPPLPEAARLSVLSNEAGYGLIPS